MVSAEPLFYGTSTGKFPDACTAQNFLERMNNIKDVQALGDPAIINRFRANLRGQAWEWYSKTVKQKISGVNSTRFHANWEYCQQIFKSEYYKEKDERDTISDIEGLTQLPHETAAEFAGRLQRALVDISNAGYEGTIHELDNPDPDNDIRAQWFVDAATNEFAQFIQDPVANNIPLLANRERQCARLVAEVGKVAIQRREHHICFERITRTLARQCREAHIRAWVRGKMLTVNKDWPTFLEALKQEERRFRPLAGQATNGTVSAISSKQDTGTDSTNDPDETQQDASMGEESVDAIKGGKFKGKGKGKGKPSAESALPKPESFKCGWCRVNSHELKFCRRLRKQLGIPIDQGIITVRPVGPGEQGPPPAKRGRFQPPAEKMDTSAIPAPPAAPPAVAPAPPGYQYAAAPADHGYYAHQNATAAASAAFMGAGPDPFAIPFQQPPSFYYNHPGNA